MRIGDWSSDVCSSDLPVTGGALSLDGVVAGLGMALATVRRGLVVGQRRGAVGRGVGLAGDVVVVGLVVAFPDDVVVAGPGRAPAGRRGLVVGRGVAPVLVGGGCVADENVVAAPPIDGVVAGLGRGRLRRDRKSVV